VRALIGSIAMIELAPPVLARALDPFPVPVRTLDALHLASLDFLRSRGLTVELATYDESLTVGARALNIPLFARATGARAIINSFSSRARGI